MSEKGPLSGAARSHANLLRSGSVPPCVHLGRSVWHALVAVHPVRALWNTVVYGQSAKREVIPYVHAGLKGVIGRYEGRNHRWEGRNPLLTCGFEGRNRGVLYEGRNHRWEGRDPLFTCGFEEQ